MIERMKRQTQKSKEIIQKNAAPVFSWLKALIVACLKKVYDLEKKYQKEAAEKTPLSDKDSASKINNLLNEAASLVKVETLTEAEKKYIEIISLDPKNTVAYKGLVNVYLALKEYKQALQISQFILKLAAKKSRSVARQTEMGQKYKTISNASEVADAYFDLGYVYQLMERLDLAMENYGKALELVPNSPRYLDQMIQSSMLLKDKNSALDLVQRLEKVNPENQKVKEYYDKIKEF